MKAKMLNSRKLFVIIALICLTVCIASLMLIKADAAELSGKDFPADVLYQMQSNVTPNGPMTFEVELYVPDAYKKASRVGSIISNYDNGSYKDSYAFEIRNGHVFVFGDNGSLYREMTYDITQSMGTDKNPSYVKACHYSRHCQRRYQPLRKRLI